MKQKNRALAMINLATMLAIIGCSWESSWGAVPAFAGFGNLFGGGGNNNNSNSNDVAPGSNGSISPFTPPGAIGAIDADDGTSRVSSKKGGSNSSSGAGGGTGNAPPSDYTEDERRMQGRYQSDLQNAKRTIAKGEKLMKSAGNNVNSKNYKRGLIFKEIGEKDLKRLKDNTPFPAQSTVDDRPNRKKPDSL
jgi:hypothetical protein